MTKVQQIGYYAKDTEGNLHQFQWEDDNTFGILNINTKEYVPSNVDDYEILEIGYFHNEEDKERHGHYSIGFTTGLYENRK